MCGQWSKVSNMSIPRSSFGVATSNGRIYCVGGYDGIHYLNTVEKYNPRTDRYNYNALRFKYAEIFHKERLFTELYKCPYRWHVSCSLQIDRYGLAVARLSLPMKSHVSSNDFS